MENSKISGGLNYRAFYGRYRYSGSYGFTQDIDIIVVAENESQAHTWAVMTYEDTEISKWEFKEIDLNKAGCTYINSHES